jgi:hypothetical protein
MFPRLWVEQVRSHIVSNLTWNTILIIGLPALYIALPQLVALGHGYLRGSGYVPTDFEERVFADHWRIIGLTALFTFLAGEVQGFLLRRNQARPS